MFELRSCRVTISDMEGVAHSVEVTASSLYEAVALALSQIRQNDWVEKLGTGLHKVIISVKSVPVDHTVLMGDFLKWVEQPGRGPAELVKHQRIREILGMPVVGETHRL